MSEDTVSLFNPNEDNSSKIFSIVLRIRHDMVSTIKEQFPEFYIYFPFERQPLGEVYIDERRVVARVKWDCAGRALSVGSFSIKDIEKIKAFNEDIFSYGYAELKDALGAEWIGREVYTYISHHAGGGISFDRYDNLRISWLNDILTPISEENRTRVLRAIPMQPQYEIEPLSKTLWVLEGDESMTQGSGFAIGAREIVTCSHCVFDDTMLFQHNNFNVKYKIENITRNEDIDIAILDIGIELEHFLAIGNPDEAQLMDHILILGHPNYRKGDTVIAQPGLITGFRTISAIRRILTNAHIVAGCSGGAALDAQGNALGIAVTGTDSEANSDQTEAHGIIPINAIKFIKS